MSTSSMQDRSRSSMQTMIITAKEVVGWIIPPFQRPLRINEKVRTLAEELKKNGGVMPGVLTLGTIPYDTVLYVVDGQHRIEAFRLSELLEAIADVRICSFDSMAEMADEFVLLQQSLVRMRPDDVLRGLEGSIESLRTIRMRCPFVGYDNVRRNPDNSPILSMTTVLKYWAGSRPETPIHFGPPPASIVRQMDENDITNLIKFLNVAFSAWGRDRENFKLWSGLNLGMCMWMYRRMVIDQDRGGVKRSTVLNHDQFKKCLMSASANPDYIDWLSGRPLSDNFRAPCYRRLKAIFSARLKEDDVAGIRFPNPPWAP